MTSPRFSTILSAAVLVLTAMLGAQGQPLAGHWEHALVRSGLHDNNSPVDGVVWRYLITLAPDVPWLRVYFAGVHLDAGSTLRIVSLRDGDVQAMRAEHLLQWRGSTAYFNGNAVMLELVAAPGSRGSFVDIDQVFAGDAAAAIPPTETICGQTDDRTPSSDPATGRVLGLGCTAWIIDAPAWVRTGCMSPPGAASARDKCCSSTCRLRRPRARSCTRRPHGSSRSTRPRRSTAAADRTTTTGSSAASPNSSTGLTTFETQNVAYAYIFVRPVPGAAIRTYAYGVDGTPVDGANHATSCSCADPDGARNQVQQTQAGTVAQPITQSLVSHRLDTCAGSTGAAILIEHTGAAFAVQVTSGCTSVGSFNYGTTFQNLGFQQALAQMIAGGAGSPPNDDCSGAVALQNGINGPFLNLGATSALPFPCSTRAGKDVWSSYVPACSGFHGFSTCTMARNIDTVIEVFGGTCASMTSLACNDDDNTFFCMNTSGIGVGAGVFAPMVAGQSYYLRVGANDGDEGAFEIAVVPPCVAGDECLGSRPLQLGDNGPFATTGATSSTPAFSCGVGAGSDLWFRYAATCTAPHTFSTCGAPLDTVLEVLAGPCGATTTLACDDDGCASGSSVTADLAAGSTYFVRVGGAGGATGTFTLRAEVGTGTGTFSQLPGACGPLSIAAAGSPNIGGTFTITLGNATSLPLVGHGFVLLPLPFCGCVAGHEWSHATFGISAQFTIPCDPAFLGATVGFQGVDLGGAGGCAAPQLTASDTIVLTIG